MSFLFTDGPLKVENKKTLVWWGAVVLWAYSSAIGAKGPGIKL